MVLFNNVVEHYRKRIKILHGCPFQSWPNRARPFHPFWQMALKRTPEQDFTSFSIMFIYIITTTYQKIGDQFCLVHISGLSHSVPWSLFTTTMKNFLRLSHLYHILFDCRLYVNKNEGCYLLERSTSIWRNTTDKKESTLNVCLFFIKSCTMYLKYNSRAIHFLFFYYIII